MLHAFSTLTSLNPSGLGIGLAIWVAATAISLYMIPALLVGVLAEAWSHSRIRWSLFAVFLGWPIALATLLIVGRPHPSASRAPLPAPSTG